MLIFCILGHLPNMPMLIIKKLVDELNEMKFEDDEVKNKKNKKMIFALALDY